MVSVYDGEDDMMGNSVDDDDAGNESDDVSMANYQSDGKDYYEALTIILKVRSVPGPVTRLGIRISTILGVMMWEFPKNHSGGYPIISFTAEVRKYTDALCENATEWERMDPNNIPANVVGAHSSIDTTVKCAQCSLLVPAEILRGLSPEAKYYVRVSYLGKQLFGWRRCRCYISNDTRSTQ